MAIPATLNPWKEKGIPLGDQYRSFRRRCRAPYDPVEVDPYTRTRVILMNGIENESWIFSHHFARMTDDPQIKALLAQTRMVEQQQQTTVNWLNPASATVIETTLAYEQVAVDLTAYLARHEPDPYLREVLNFGLLEDFDHLYRYSELYSFLENGDPEKIVKGRTEVLPGRPTMDHHNDPVLRLRRHYERNRALPVSKLHVLTLLSAEQQTYLFYKSHGFQYPNRLARELYAEIGEVEEEHVTMYESLLDPTETLLERQVLHQLMEVYNYFHCYETEVDPRIKGIWEEFLMMELEHLQLWAEVMRRHEGVDPEELFGRELTVDFQFTENKEYIRRVIDAQRDVRLLDHGFARLEDLPADWPSYRYQKIVAEGRIPSEDVVDRAVLEARSEGPGDATLRAGRDLAVRVRREPAAPAATREV